MPIPTTVLPEMFLKLPKQNRAQTFRRLFESLSSMVDRPSLTSLTPKQLTVSSIDAPGYTTKICGDWITRSNLFSIRTLFQQLKIIEPYGQAHETASNVFEDMFGVLVNLSGSHYADYLLSVSLAKKPGAAVNLDYASFHHWNPGHSMHDTGWNELDEPAFNLAILALAVLPTDMFRLVAANGLVIGALTGTFYTYHCEHPLVLIPYGLLRDEFGSDKGLHRVSHAEMSALLAKKDSEIHPIGVFEDCRTAP